MYHISRLDDNTILITTDNGEEVCKIPVDCNTPLTIKGGINSIIRQYNPQYLGD